MQMALSRRFCTAKCMRKYVKQKLDDDKLENGNRKCHGHRTWVKRDHCSAVVLTRRNGGGDPKEPV
ncbi:uncharacterized protein Dyak_GE27477, isoform A [Drosophila yakuba]|uniref:Uncharacterized protein, isoform A n=1 Tax=Drosophila yakuba TaxID=7245 RepID=A0A0R1DUC3_DROYA|nr:uncharacterized protein Dyak_GE27477, isoform A [Drosophila yakuba]